VNIFRADPADMLTNMNTFRIGPKIMVQDNELIFMHDNHIDDNIQGLRKTISMLKMRRYLQCKRTMPLSSTIKNN